MVMVLLSAAGAASSFTPQAASDATAATEATTAMIFLRFTMNPLFFSAIGTGGLRALLACVQRCPLTTKP